MKETSLLLQLTGEIPLFRIVDFLVENKGLEFTKKDIIEGSGISRATLFNYWNELEKYSLVKVTKKFGNTKLFTLNTSSPIVKRILDLEKVLIESAIDNASSKNKSLVSQHGKKLISV